ncbi:MAG: hypothetical protein LAN83_16160 [Acidobacteriia bacterium]|nr:hypothetical protein [Terriglobia bacterium]
MARIAPPQRLGFVARITSWMTKRRLGKELEPLLITSHHRSVFRGVATFEFMLDRSRLVDARLKALASMKAAAMVGCPF